MKKYFILAAAAILTIAACSKNEADTTAYEQAKVINFNTFTGKAKTKAGPLNNLVFPHDAGAFGVYAYYLSSGTWAANFASSKRYMGAADTSEGAAAEDAAAGVTVEFNNSLYIWNPNPTYYWPLEGKLTFFAYYPLTLATPKFDLSEKEFSSGSFTVNSTPASQVEVLVSSFTTDKQANDTQYSDVVADPASGSTSGDNKGVEIVFNHMLSQVVFTAATASDVITAGMSFKVNSITVGARKTSTGMTVVPGSDPEWEEPTSLQPFNVLVEANTFPNSTENASNTPANYLTSTQSKQIGDALLMIPNNDFLGDDNKDDGEEGNNGDDDEYVTVKYTLYRISDGLPMGSKTVKLYLNDNDGTVDKWEAGKKYTYQLTIGLDKIYFAPTVTDWVTENQAVTVPGNGTTL